MKVLISVASRHGATDQIARRLADTLSGEGFEVELLPPERVESLDGYAAAVLGSAVYFGRWMIPARQLAGRLGEEFKTRPVWLFSSGPIGDPPRPGQEPADAPLLRAATGAREHRVFNGRLERKGLSPVERVAVAALRVPDQDNRDWTGITAWAQEIAAALKPAKPITPAA
jgi:menaquinone-dependent protoporphyrinogen oxidase